MLKDFVERLKKVVQTLVKAHVKQMLKPFRPRLIDPFSDTAAILILPPGHPIVLTEICLFFCGDDAALSQ